MRTFWLLFLGVGLGLNGLMMLAAPMTWYGIVPGVDDTGPFNLHFIRDIGSIYLIVGATLLWLQRDARAWPAAMTSGGFLALHAGVHAIDFLAGRVSLPHIASDLLLVFAPAVVVLWLARPGASHA